MNFKEINDYARQLLRDVNRTIFQEIEINRAINEGIDRMRSVKELSTMKNLVSPNQEPNLIPSEYHHLLALFSASRCFFQDEQFTQSATLMNEFESKFFELRQKIENGDIIIEDEDGNIIDGMGSIDYIKDIYFTRNKCDDETIIM